MSECYPNSLEHVLAELEYLGARMPLHVRSQSKGKAPGEDGRFRGLYVSENDIEAILEHPHFELDSLSPQEPLDESLRRLELEIAARKKESQHRGVTLRLCELERLFGLSRFDMEVILLCLLPELELRYQLLYALLQDDVTRKSPTVDLVLNLLCDSLGQKLKARGAFSPEAPLLKHYLVQLYEEHPTRPGPLLGRFIQLDERVAGYLLDSDHPDARLLPFSHLAEPVLGLADLALPGDIKDRLAGLVAQVGSQGVVCYFYGPYGVGKQATAAAIAAELGSKLLSVDLRQMAISGTPPDLAIPLVFREALLQKAVLFLKGFDAAPGEEKGIATVCHLMAEQLQEYPQWVILGGEKDWQPRGILRDKPFFGVELPLPSYPVRKALWEKLWNGDSALAPGVNLSELADKFRLSGGQISDVAATARNLAWWRAPLEVKVTADDLSQACRKQCRETLGSLARKVHAKYCWDDIILPADQVEQLHEICGRVKHHHTVHGDWGFDRKLSLGKGLNILFAGPPGTGKTMAAEIIAGELGLDLYKLDLSSIVSKYIGETEKNLERIFQEGQTSNAILFFDEADALFGKRSEVKDSHDRYANIEVAYLLQRMEEYEGAVILATNMRKNMDEAFARRMHFAVEFPMPEEADRLRIWQSIFPEEVPLSRDVALSFLARQFKISGGNIRNIALAAAFLAAQDGSDINMERLMRATKREYQKMGKLCTEGDFVQYFDMVKG